MAGSIDAVLANVMMKLYGWGKGVDGCVRAATRLGARFLKTHSLRPERFRPAVCRLWNLGRAALLCLSVDY